MATSISLIYSVKDAKNESSTFEVHIPSATSLANATIFAQQMALLIAPLLKGFISRIGIVFSVALPGGIATTADADSDVEEGARLQARTAGGFNTGFRLATFDEAFIAPGGTAVDTEDEDVAALVAAMISGIALGGVGGTGTVSPSDGRDDDITSVTSFKEDFQSSRG